MTEGADPADNLITVEELDDVEHEIITAKRRGSESGDNARRDSVLSEQEEESLAQGANILSSIKEKIFEQADCRHVLRLFRRQFFRRRELAMLDEAGAEQRAAKQKIEDRKKAILEKQQSAAFKRTGPEWEHPNEALERLRKNPMNGAVAPSDLGGQNGVPFSEADRWAPVIGDQGNGEASHIPPGFYFNPQVADGFAPENLPNFFTSSVARFQAIVGDTGVGEADHIACGAYEWDPDQGKINEQANASFKSLTDRIDLGFSSPVMNNPKMGPGAYDVRPYTSFGPLGVSIDENFPGKGQVCKFAKRPRFRYRVVLFRELHTRPFRRIHL